MSHEDFDVESLADYLHLRSDQVLRLAERGKIPGRRISGQWRFSRGEIHQWWEERIGISDDDELAQLESVLQGGTKTLVSFSLAELLPDNGVAVPLEARTRSSVITAMVRLASQTGLMWDEQKMEEAIRLRENLHPTALDNGVALLHPRRPLPAILAEPHIVFGRTTAGIPFGGPVLTDLFFLIASRDDRGHLRVLARLSRLVSDASFLVRLRELSTSSEIRELVREYEAQLPEP